MKRVKTISWDMDNEYYYPNMRLRVQIQIKNRAH